MNTATPWAAGRFDGCGGKPQVLFGRMYEDAAIERAAFTPGTEVFCIASAGCTALELAARHDVTAVDINAAQLAYAKARAAGAPPVTGSAERLLAVGRALLAPCGWRRARVETFLDLKEPAVQLEFWRRHLDTRRFRLATDMLFSFTGLRMIYQWPLLAALPVHFGRVIRRRLERCFARHPNRTNRYARALLLGAGAECAPRVERRTLRFVHSDAAEYLESCPAGRFAGFTLSNILDGAPSAYRARLMAAVRHAAAPGAVAILRSFAEPLGHDPANRAAEDRSILWGIVDVRPVSALHAGVWP